MIGDGENSETADDGRAVQLLPSPGNPSGLLLLVALLVTLAALAGATTALVDDPREGWFRETSADAGIDYRTTHEASDMVGGVYVSDYDRDGHADVLLTGGDAPVLYHNTGGKFERADVLPQTDRTIKGALWVDHDTDGWDDLLLIPRIGHPVFLENDGGTFHRTAVGLNVTLDIGLSATTGDYNRDGCPDLFVYQSGDWRERVPARAHDGPLQSDNGAPNHLFRGNCSSFARVTDAGIQGTHWSYTGSFADLTGDGRPDIHVANDFNHDVVYRNRGDGRFERIELPNSNRHGMASAAADVAGDDTLDVFVTNIEYDDPERIQEMGNGLGITNRGNNLFVYTDEGFEDRATTLGIRQGGWGWAGTLADLDGDGDRDLVHVTKDHIRETEDGPSPVHTRPAFYERTDDGFVKRDSALLGLEQSSGRGLVVFDHDDDGDRDILVADMDGRFKLYENTRGNNDSLLVDVEPAPDGPALGAEVRVSTADGTTHKRTVTSEANFLSQSPRTQHFGLDGATVDRIRVAWPDGQTVVREDVRAGTHVRIRYDGTVQPMDGAQTPAAGGE